VAETTRGVPDLFDLLHGSRAKAPPPRARQAPRGRRRKGNEMGDDAAFFREHGYLLCKGVFADAEVEELRGAVEGVLARAAGTDADRNHAWAAAQAGEGEEQVVLKGFHDLPYHDAVFLRALAHPRLVEALVAAIGPNVQLHHTKMLVKPPEKGAPFPMHQDYPYFPHARHTVTAASVHLDDTTEENGCLHVIPGSHLGGPIAEVGESHSLDHPLEAGLALPAEAGDVLLFNYLTIHGSGVNRSARPRRNVLFQYRGPADEPLLGADGREEHVDWGQGLMVAGHNPAWFARRPRFDLRPAEQSAATS
jgi:ectoine hydroxylase-related dioxygenase (phytanoyl-CoA dioxygenase family)